MALTEVLCELCLKRTTTRPYRAAGLDVCAECWRVQVADASAAWALHVQPKFWTEWVKSGDNRTFYQFAEVRVHHPSPCPYHATFTPDRPAPALLRWLGLGRSGDPEVGDPLFDDHVLVQCDDPGITELLASEGLQSGIMEVTANGRLEIGGNEVFVKMALAGESDLIDQAQTMALAVAIAVQIERYCRRI